MLQSLFPPAGAKRPKKAAAESKKAKAEEDDEAKESDKENAPGAKSSKKAKKSAAKKEEEPKEEEQPAVKDEATGLPIGSGRRAAQVRRAAEQIAKHKLQVTWGGQPAAGSGRGAKGDSIVLTRIRLAQCVLHVSGACMLNANRLVRPMPIAWFQPRCM